MNWALIDETYLSAIKRISLTSQRDEKHPVCAVTDILLLLFYRMPHIALKIPCRKCLRSTLNKLLLIRNMCYCNIFEMKEFELRERKKSEIGDPHICESARAFSCPAWSNGKHGDCCFPEITGPKLITCTCAKVSITAGNASAIK